MAWTPAATTWTPAQPRLRPTRILVSWATSALAFLIAAGLLPGTAIDGFWGAAAVAAAVAVLNALLPPVVAALRLPATVIVGTVALVVLNAFIIEWAADLTENALTVDGFGAALALAFVASAVSVVIAIVLGTDDDDEYTFRVVRRVARRQGKVEPTDVPGLILLEIDGLGLPILRRAMQEGSLPTLARWLRDGSHDLLEWETDLSSQTGASQAGILLGSNEDIPAFRWVEKERGILMTCSNPRDCAEIEARHSSDRGLLSDGGSSRGNLLSGLADAQILTVSRMAAEVRANPGYRAFFANGYNVTRVLVLFVWEIWLELVAAARQRRRDIQPRGHRGGTYPLIRGAMCVLVRDLIVHSVLTDMMAGRPIVYATFSSYDEVAHHSGLMRPDTLEALRKLDQQFARIERARPYAPRPYELAVLSDHGQTQGATFRQRHGYGLDELVERSLSATGGDVLGLSAGGDEGAEIARNALDEARGKAGDKKASNDVSDRQAVVLGSGNLGLVYLMEQSHRFTLEELQARHPDLLPALVGHEHIGWVMVRSERDGPVVLGAGGRRVLATGAVDGEDPLAPFSPTAARHLQRTDGFPHAPDLLVGSFYDADLEEGCAFEELISFHGGLGGPQTRPFVLHPRALAAPDEPIIGAEALHRQLLAWRDHLQGVPT